VRRVRALFISDVHLGMRPTRITQLIDFLRWHEAETIYLVGDIVDGWQLRRSWYWDDDHDEAVRLVLRMARAGTAVTYIPGNHDEMLRPWLPLGLELGGVKLRAEAEHRTADGRRILVTHGDAFDGVVGVGSRLWVLGDRAYGLALVLNRWFNAARRLFGHPYRSLSHWLKRQVGGSLAAAAIARFEAAVVHEARRRGFDGVVCGHIHHPVLREQADVLYMNTGDWVESCTALVDWAREHREGGWFVGSREAVPAAASPVAPPSPPAARSAEHAAAAAAAVANPVERA
jgi:UDP-2,3-diacylglucosamine pyrophosphatase LpxH